MSETKKPILDSQAYITLGYLTVVITGMMFDFNYYDRFSINIFEYADVLDFLLAPVKNVQLMLFAFGTFLIVFLLYQLDRLWERKSPNTYKKFNFGASKRFSDRYRPVGFTLSLFLYFLIAADHYGERMYNSYQEDADQIEIIFESDQRQISGKLIGKNTDYIFLESEDKAVKAIPVSSDVQEIVISRPENLKTENTNSEDSK